MKAKIVSVQGHFRKMDYERARLAELHGLIPVLPCDTRWNSQLDCFESYMKNQTKYLEISRESGTKLPASVLEVIHDNEFLYKFKNTSTF